MRYLFRCDASSFMGSGHVMRCLALGKRLAASGHGINFACRELPGHLGSVVREWGFPVHLLNAPKAFRPDPDSSLPSHAPWLRCAWNEDSREVLGLIAGKLGGRVDAVVVDHYGLDARWEDAVRGRCSSLAVIDDLADRRHSCDLILDQTLTENPDSRYAGLLPGGCRTFFGPRFALLREEFGLLRRITNRKMGGLQRVLVYFGGTDLEDNVGKALRALDLAGWGDRAIDLVLPPEHPQTEKYLAGSRRISRFTVHTRVERMSELMAQADFSIGAGGTTSWERCCLGLPCLAICAAPNQAPILQGLHLRGALIDLGTSETITAEGLAAAIMALDADPERVRSLSHAAWDVVDGEGADRVAAGISGLPGSYPA